MEKENGGVPAPAPHNDAEGGGGGGDEVTKVSLGTPLKRKRDLQNGKGSEPDDLEEVAFKLKKMKSSTPSPLKKKHYPSPVTVENSPGGGDLSLGGHDGSLEASFSPFVTSTGSTLHAASMNMPGTTVKGIHVDMQRRFLVEMRLSKVTGKGGTVITYKIKSEATGQLKRLSLRGAWSELDWLAPGTLVNIVGVEPDENDCFNVERDHGYLIIEPDKLVSATSIISQLFCERKSALVSRFFMGAFDNFNMFRGVLAHELICRAMAGRITKKDQLVKAARRICERQDMLERAYGIGMKDRDLAKVYDDVAQWVERFMRQRYNSPKLDPKYQSFKFMDLLGVEDNIWNPTFGLKGKIDATVLIQKDSSDKPIIAPLEFKTGSTQPQKRQVLKADHVGQVALYTLMMSNKFGTIDDAILYYISDDSLSLHPSKTIELQQLILMRNRYIRYTTLSGGELPHLPRPEGVDFDFQCKNCEARNMCTLQLRKQNIPEEHLSKTEKRILESTPLSDEEFKFMDEWLNVINAETEEVEKKFNEKWLWTKTPAQREAAGTCVTDLKICGERVAFKNSSGRTGYLVILRKRSINNTSSQENHIPLPFRVDDFVVFSSNVEVCINYGVVVSIKGNEITLMLEQPLHKEYADADFIYCVDKINSSSPIASQFGYLVRLMEKSEDAARLREYIINKKQPKFEKVKVPMAPVQAILDELNAEQKRVITKSLATDSFLFVRGCPGSGKTTTIVCLLRALAVAGKTVLVASYTGTALENILLKYKKYSQNFVKIGTNSRVDGELSEFTTKTLCKSIKIISDLTKAYNAPVVGTTLLSLKHPIFQVRRFDYCIVDEASQALPTAVLGVLSLARKYIVFGDPNQLPPVLQSSLVKSRNISDNFFSLIATPVSTVKLNIQYRMNRTITSVANRLLYENQMKCGSKKQEDGYLNLTSQDIRTFLETKVSSIPARRALCHAVSKVFVKAVAFLDTSELMAYESRFDDTISNESEKDITIACTRLFVESKLDPKSIGIIAPYRGQVNLLRNSLKKMDDEKYHKIEVNTVDQYQGREMEVIICSFTKSSAKPVNLPPAQGAHSVPYKEGILEDIRRLNVAITRARNKLLLIGNRSTLEKYKPLKTLFGILTEEQLYKLTAEQLEGLKKLADEGSSPPASQNPK